MEWIELRYANLEILFRLNSISELVIQFMVFYSLVAFGYIYENVFSTARICEILNRSLLRAAHLLVMHNQQSQSHP